MKIFLAVMTLFTVAHAYATSECINLNGVYKTDAVTAMRFTQNSCISLKIEFGQIKSNGKVDWYKVPIKTVFNGNPTCDTFGCIKGSISEKSVEISRDTAGLAYNNTHGDCSFKNESYTKNTDGSVTQSQDVYECHDGYVGQMQTSLNPLN